MGEWERLKKYNQCVSTLFCQQEGHDTVGAVALDLSGNVASATSTGGITGKREGRVGDSPLAGSGGYADSRSGAVTSTGHGESITKVCLAHRVVQDMQENPANQAGCEGLAYMQSRVGGSGGLVAVDVSGRCAAEFTTVRMPWSAITRNNMIYSLSMIITITITTTVTNTITITSTITITINITRNNMINSLSISCSKYPKC